MRIFQSECPVCNGKNIQFALKAVDYTVSMEEFEIWECQTCTHRFTQNFPDKNEIDAYYKSENYISHSDTEKGLINSLYHKVRKRTLGQKKKLVENYTGIVSGKILDFGCGTGAFLHTMKQAKWETTGLEPEKDARVKAKQLYDLNVSDSEMLFTINDETFDAITLWHVLEHVHDLPKYLKQLKEILKPGGSIFIAVPNYTCYDESVYHCWWAAYDVPRHLYHFSPTSMRYLLLQHGLKLKCIKPMFYDSFYVSMLSEKYRSGKNNFIKAAWVGLISNYKALLNKEKCSSIIYIINK